VIRRGDRGAERLVLEPPDHLRIKQESAFPCWTVMNNHATRVSNRPVCAGDPPNRVFGRHKIHRRSGCGNVTSGPRYPGREPSGPGVPSQPQGITPRPVSRPWGEDRGRLHRGRPCGFRDLLVRMQFAGCHQRLHGDGVAGAPHLLEENSLRTRRGRLPDRRGHAFRSAGRIAGHDGLRCHDHGVAFEWLEAR